MTKDFFYQRSVLMVALFAGMVMISWPSTPLRAETMFVTDMLQLELYATAEMTGMPLRKLKSGDRLEILESSGRTAHVQLESGESGWVKSLYLQTDEPARTRINKLEDTNASLEKTVTKLRAQLGDQQDRVAELESIRDDTDSQAAAEAEELKRLRIENTDMEESLTAYSSSVPLGWVAAFLVLILAGGFAAGWYWFDTRSRARHGGYRIY
ncbi:MAG: hypothetical protein QF790_07855 [Gammaproteobacteria bacterium]|nr:hypothetical protein [Gammaproteobacteria bacterium]